MPRLFGWAFLFVCLLLTGLHNFTLVNRTIITFSAAQLFFHLPVLGDRSRVHLIASPGQQLVTAFSSFLLLLSPSSPLLFLSLPSSVHLSACESLNANQHRLLTSDHTPRKRAPCSCTVPLTSCCQADWMSHNRLQCVWQLQYIFISLDQMLCG